MKTEIHFIAADLREVHSKIHTVWMTIRDDKYKPSVLWDHPMRSIDLVEYTHSKCFSTPDWNLIQDPFVRSTIMTQGFGIE